MSIGEKEDGPREGIRGPQLRQAGESLREERLDVLLDGWMAPLIFLIFIVVWIAVEWVRVIFHLVPSYPAAVGMTVAAAFYIVFFAWKMRRAAGKLKRLKQGWVGEVHVGQFLDDMCRGEKYRVLHDVPGEPGKDFNVDHVLIGPGGIFAIEVKHWTKPFGDARLFYDGERVMKEGGIWDDEPVRQARANAEYVRGLVAKRTGRDKKGIPVRAVLIVPGWFVEGKSTGKEVWVLVPEALLGFLRKEARRLKGEDVALFYEAVGTWVKGFGK